MFKVYQIQPDRALYDIVNEEGWGALDRYPELAPIKAQQALRFEGSESFEPWMLFHYTHVADVNTDNLEDAFTMLNLWYDPDSVHRITEKMASLSVGDLLVDEDNRMFMVDPVGFVEIFALTRYASC